MYYKTHTSYCDMMSTLISIRLSNEIKTEIDELSKIEHQDKSSLIRDLLQKGIKDKKIENAVIKYKEGKITLWKASNIADVSLWKMIEILKEKGIEYQYGIYELREDLKALEEN